MKNYHKYLVAPGKEKNIFNDAWDFFNYKAFKSYKDSTKETTFINKFVETTLFASFIEARSFGEINEEEILYFDNCLKEKRTKKKP